MRIVFFSFITNFGGAAQSEVYLASRLRDAGHEPVFVEPYGASAPYCESIAQAGIEHHVLTPVRKGRIIGGVGVRRMFKTIQALPDLIKIRNAARSIIPKLEPDVISCLDFKALAIAASMPALRRTPLTMYLREWYVPQMVPRLGQYLWRHRCTGLIAVSHATRAAVYCSGIPWERIHVLQNPIDVEEQQRKAVQPLEASLPGSDCSVKILLPAFIQERKQQHVAVRSAKRLADCGVDAAMWMAGGLGIPDPRNEQYFEFCKKEAEVLGVQDRVFWLGHRNDIPQIMGRSDIVILPSRREGHPRVMLEAMALGKPYIGCPIAGHIEMILPRLTGMLHEVGDDHGLADAVHWLYRNPDAAITMGQDAKRYVQLSHRPEDHTRRAIDIFERLIAKR